MTHRKEAPRKSPSEQVHRLLARCDKLDGLVWRERCKWKICDGRWGRDGCPANAHDRHDRLASD